MRHILINNEIMEFNSRNNFFGRKERVETILKKKIHWSLRQCIQYT